MPAMQYTIAELINQLNDRDYYTRTRAAVALGDARDPRAIPALLKILSDNDHRDELSRANICAAEALAKIGERALMPLLVTFQEQRDHPNDIWRRNWVADALGILGDPRAVEVLINGLDDQDVRAGVAEALGRIGDGSPPTFTAGVSGYGTGGAV